MFRRAPKAASAAVALPLAALTLTACGGASTTSAAGSPHEGTVVWVRSAPIDGWEGDRCLTSSGPVNAVVYSNLLRIQSPDGDGIVAGLADSWTRDDATSTWTLTLRDDATFSNGEPVTADDVVFSVDEWRAGAVSGVIYDLITDVTAPDESTVVITTAAPDSVIPEMLTWCTSTVYPADYAGMTKEEFLADPIGAGPYAVAEVENSGTASEKITLEPNEYYYGDHDDSISSLVIQSVEDAEQRALMFRSGEADILEDVDKPLADQLDADAVVRAATQGLQALTVNTTKGDLADARLREAISAAIDRDAIATTIGAGAVAATGALPINMPGAIDPTTPYGYDPDHARELLAELGGIEDLTLTYNSSTYIYGLIAQSIQSQLAEVGITVDLVAQDATTWSTSIGEGDYELTMQPLAALSPSIFDPILALAVYAYPGTGLDNAALLEFQAAGRSAADDEAAAVSVQALQDRVLADGGWIGVVNTSMAWAVQPWVEGFTPLQYGSFPVDALAVG